MKCRYGSCEKEAHLDSSVGLCDQHQMVRDNAIAERKAQAEELAKSPVTYGDLVGEYHPEDYS